MKTVVVVLAFAALSLHASPTRVLSVDEPEAAIGGPLTLRVDGDHGDCKQLILFIQRSPMRGLIARCNGNAVTFTLAVNDKNAKKWHRILGRQFFRRYVTVGLGTNEQIPFESDIYAQPFRVLTKWRAFVLTLLTILLIAAFIAARKFTDVLDSFTRIQVAMWLIVISISYTYIWAVTSETETINATCLALLAIGAGTAVGAAMIGSAKTIDAKTVVQTLANAPPDEITPMEITGPSGLHAVIVGTWTAVLAIIFVAYVWRRLEMPNFTTQLLSILGITGGTYLAFAMKQKN